VTARAPPARDQQRFDADPVAAAEAAGMHELALGLEREIRELVGLADRIANDDAYTPNSSRTRCRRS
jgi:hypothetical protein